MIVTHNNFPVRRLGTELNHGRMPDRAMGRLGASRFRDANMSENTPPRRGPPLLRGGMAFNLSGLGDVTYATDAAGNVLMDSSGDPVLASDTSTISDMITKGLALLNAQQVFQLNLQRAQSGLQPINVPSPMINLGVAGLSSSVLLLGLGAIVLLAVSKRGGGKHK